MISTLLKCIALTPEFRVVDIDGNEKIFHSIDDVAKALNASKSSCDIHISTSIKALDQLV